MQVKFIVGVGSKIIQKNKNQMTEHLKLAIVGNVDSGKSTLVGVLTKGIKDDGRGIARGLVFNFKHEQNNGRTSSIAQEIMGFDEKGKQVIPQHLVENKNKYWREIVERSHKVVTFLDLCGHEKYLKTTIFGLVSMVPDYSMIVVGANMGISKMTKEHLALTLFLKVPFVIVLSKVDIAPANVLKENMDSLRVIMKQVKKTMVVMNEEQQDVGKMASIMHTNNVVPIFHVSNVTGEGVEQLKLFIALLPNRDKTNKALMRREDPMQYDIHETFQVKGVGLVVSGLIRSGEVRVGQQLMLGPDVNAQWKQVTVKSIHLNRLPVEVAGVGELGCLMIKPTKNTEKLERADLKKGMVLVDPTLKPEANREFEASIHVLQNPTCMGFGYQAMMHCGVVRQCVEIRRIQNKQTLKTGDVDVVRLRFLYKPEYLRLGQLFLLREGRTKVFGYITNIIGNHQLELEAQEQQLLQL